MHNTLKQWNSIKQKSLEWYKIRNTIITASDVSSILEINPFTSKYEILSKKSKIFENKDIKIDKNPATKWGDFHEPLARQFYETMPLINGKRRVHEVGLIYHKKYKWLAASPDGIVESMEKNSNDKFWLLEIKCPYKREFKNKGHKIPSYIWIQTQIQMEVCDIPFCHLLQCKYFKEGEKSILLNRKITTIMRDSEWFNNTALPKLLEFWELINKAKQYNNFINPYPNPKEWVSTNSFTGFLLKDPIIDWLNMYENNEVIQNLLRKYPERNFEYKNKVKKRINVFNSIIDNIKQFGLKNKLNVLYITNIDEKWNEGLSVYKYNITKKALEDNTDIIIRPVILDYKRKSYGIPDIIMKNKVAYNYLKTYNNVNGLKHLLKDGYTTFCITLKHNFPQKGLLNKWDNVLKNIYTGYSSTINSVLNNENTLVSLIGTNTCIVIDPETIDTKNCIKFEEGISWVRTLRESGEKWLEYITNDKVPNNSNIMPNMCNKFDQKWRNIKKDLAEKWGELTLLWYCGINQRNKAHEKGIYTWKTSNETLTPSEIVMSLYTDSKNEDTYNFSNRKRIIKSMIKLNRTDKIYSSKDFGEITEPYIDTQNALEVYIDFEVLSGKNINNNISSRLQTPQDIIYLIGMQWKCLDTNKIEFKSFISSSLTSLAEKNMIKNWWDNVKELKRKYKVEKIILYHWSPAEERFLNRAFKRHSLSYIKNNLKSGNYDLRDLMEMYIDAEVVIKGVWGYSVKDIAKGLHKFGLISEVWDDTEKGGDTINSGEGTLTTATNCYKEIISSGMEIQNNPNFKPICEYNKMDCNVLYHLLSFLRTFIYNNDPRQKRRNKRNLEFKDKLNKNYKKIKF
jgi:putative phage-type endonuclease